METSNKNSETIKQQHIEALSDVTHGLMTLAALTPSEHDRAFYEAMLASVMAHMNLVSEICNELQWLVDVSKKS